MVQSQLSHLILGQRQRKHGSDQSTYVKERVVSVPLPALLSISPVQNFWPRCLRAGLTPERGALASLQIDEGTELRFLPLGERTFSNTGLLAPVGVRESVLVAIVFK